MERFNEPNTHYSYKERTKYEILVETDISYFILAEHRSCAIQMANGFHETNNVEPFKKVDICQRGFYLLICAMVVIIRQDNPLFTVVTTYTYNFWHFPQSVGVIFWYIVYKCMFNGKVWWLMNKVVQVINACLIRPEWSCFRRRTIYMDMYSDFMILFRASIGLTSAGMPSYTSRILWIGYVGHVLNMIIGDVCNDSVFVRLESDNRYTYISVI